MSDAVTTTLAWGPMLTALGGGLALFLYGMRKLTDALRTVAGEGMKTLLARLTTNRFTAAAAGAMVTAVIQSSSVTTVMVVSFVGAGVMTFAQSIGVILGANIGTTITAQIIAFKITSYSLALIAGGFLTEVLGKTRRVQQVGVLVMGLGLLFFGMQLMSEATSPLRSYAPFIDAMSELRNPLLGILAGAAFTAVVQSSSATTGIVIVLASQGFIPLEAGVALVLGANVGTCVTAMLAAIGRPRDAVKAAVVHVLFNIAGVLLLVGFIPQFAELVRSFSPVASGVADADRLAAEVPRQIANAHTLFNVTATLLFLGFTNTLAAVVERIVPRARPAPAGPGTPRHLDKMFLEQPSVALDQVKLELAHMGELVTASAGRALPLALTGDEISLRALEDADEDVDQLHDEVLVYAGRIAERDLVEPQTRRLQRYIGVANYLENMGDVVETGLVPVGLKRLKAGRPMDQDAHDWLMPLHDLALAAISDALTAFAEDDPLRAQSVRQSKADFNRKTEALRLLLARKLAGGDRAFIRHYRLATECIDDLKRLHTLARRIAMLVLEAWEERREREAPAKEDDEEETEVAEATVVAPDEAPAAVDTASAGGGHEAKTPPARRHDG